MTVSFNDGAEYMSQLAAAAGTAVRLSGVSATKRIFRSGDGAREAFRVFTYSDGLVDDQIYNDCIGSTEVLLLDSGTGTGLLCVYFSPMYYYTAPAPEDPTEGLAWVRMAYRCSNWS